VVQALRIEGGNVVDRCCCHVRFRGIQHARPSRNWWHHCVDMMSGSYTSTRRLWMLAGHALFRCPVFNTALRRHRLRDGGRTSHNKRGRLPVGTEPTDTPTVLPRK
jgi:hypothetical protein